MYRAFLQVGPYLWLVGTSKITDIISTEFTTQLSMPPFYYVLVATLTFSGRKMQKLKHQQNWILRYCLVLS